MSDRQVSIGGEDFTLRYSFRAFAALQEHWGMASMQEVIGRLVRRDLGADDLVGIVWAGLRTHHPDATKERVLDALDAVGVGGLPGLLAAIQGAILASLPQPEEDKGAGAKAGARPSTAGRSPAS
jgi:hypothetical protein